MRYLAVLGRQPELSLAELEALFGEVERVAANLALFDTEEPPKIARLGGSLKLARKLEQSPLDYLRNSEEGKITLGISDFSSDASRKTATLEALKLKRILVRHGRSVRVVENKAAELSTAASLHNGLSGKNSRKCEFIKVNNDWFIVVGIQDIDAYARRDQARPARDAAVGMLPPKLAQILVNLCGLLPPSSRFLDPFCGTGVVLQEALLMGYRVYGTDLSDRMIEYSEKNLNWLFESTQAEATFSDKLVGEAFVSLEIGDATNYRWSGEIDAVACEGYLGRPMSVPPSENKLKTEQNACSEIILGFLKNLSTQIRSGTPIVFAIPAWLRPNGTYSRLKILDYLTELGYNVSNKSREGLLYHREGQVVARDIIILRKK